MNDLKKFQKEKHIGATETQSVKITKEQKLFVLRNRLNLSKLVRDILNKMIGDNEK